MYFGDRLSCLFYYKFLSFILCNRFSITPSPLLLSSIFHDHSNLFLTFRAIMLSILESVHNQRNPAKQTRHRYAAHDDALRADPVLDIRFDMLVAVETGYFFGAVA